LVNYPLPPLEKPPFLCDGGIYPGPLFFYPDFKPYSFGEVFGISTASYYLPFGVLPFYRANRYQHANTMQMTNKDSPAIAPTKSEASRSKNDSFRPSIS
jgi:hypothetical protein